MFLQIHVLQDYTAGQIPISVEFFFTVFPSLFTVKIISDQTPFGGFRALAAFPSVCSEFFLFLGSPGGGSSPLEVNVDGEKTRVSTL